MKLLLTTNGDFQIVCQESGQLVRHTGYTLVEPTDYLSGRIAAGQVTLLATLNDEASDDEWKEYVASSDGDLKLALESFSSSYQLATPAPEPQPEPQPEPEVKPSKSGK